MDKNKNIFAWLVDHFGNLPDTSRASVKFDEQEVRLSCPDGHVERIAWRDIQRVVIITTDLGPTIDDVFYVLEGGSSVCPVPSQAAGMERLADRLFAFPRFNSENFMAAISSTDNAEFIMP